MGKMHFTVHVIVFVLAHFFVLDFKSMRAMITVKKKSVTSEYIYLKLGMSLKIAENLFNLIQLNLTDILQWCLGKFVNA